MPMTTISVYRDRVGLSAISMVSIMLSLGLLLGSSSATDLLLRIASGLFGLFFGLSGIFNLAKANDEKPAVEINDDGILVQDISTTAISWDGITEARLGKTRATWNISLKLRPDAFAATRPKLGSRLFSRSTVTFMASYLDRSPESMMELIIANIEASRKIGPLDPSPSHVHKAVR